MKITVPRFWIQPTASFPDGAPQRDEYNTNGGHYADCLRYEAEWLATYICGKEGCKDMNCPQHNPRPTKQ